MTRRIPGIPVLPTLSFLLLATVIALWAGSPRHADILLFYTPAAHLAGAASDHKGLPFCKTDAPFDGAMSLSAETMSTSSGEFVQVRDLLFDPAKPNQHLLGFRWAAGKLGPWQWGFGAVQWGFGAVIVPYWALLIPLAILPLRGFRRGIVRQRRKRRGQCLTCGYDLRETSDRCPECGTPIRGGTMVVAGRTIWRRLPAGAFSWLVLGVVAAACISALVRGRRAAAIAATAPPEQVVFRRMIGPVDLRNPTLRQSVIAIGRAGNTRVELSGIDPEFAAMRAESRLTIRGVNLHAALRAAWKLWRFTEDPALQVCASGAVVRVAPASQMPRFVRSYPVARILSEAQTEFDRDADEVARRPVDSRRGVVGMLFSGSAPPSRLDATQELGGLIMNTVRPDDWMDNGGIIGRVWVVAGRLWVLQTQEGHAAVRAFLALLESPAQPTTEASSAEDHADLDQLIPEVKLESTTLESAIDTLREKTRSNIVVYWDDLEAAGVKRDAPIRLHLWNVSLGQALDVVLTLAGGDRSGMRAVQDGIIVIATPQKILDKNSVVRIYDIRDLIERFLRDGRPPGAFTQPAIANVEVRAADTPASSAGPTFEEMVESITRLIEDAVDTDSWKDNGGSTGAMRELAGRLIITQTPSGHRQIVNLLRTLRAGVSKEGTELPAKQAQRH